MSGDECRTHALDEGDGDDNEMQVKTVQTVMRAVGMVTTCR